MANKLYEEACIQDIADAIREKTGNTTTYVVSEMGAAIRNISSSGGGGGESDESDNRQVYTGEIVSTVVGSGAYAVLAQDDVLAEHRNDEALFVRVEFDVGAIAYTLAKTWAANALGTIPATSTTNRQFILRYAADAAEGNQVSSYAVNDNTNYSSGTGRLYITEDGELRYYSNSGSSYAIRPSTYKVVVEW